MLLLRLLLWTCWMRFNGLKWVWRRSSFLLCYAAINYCWCCKLFTHPQATTVDTSDCCIRWRGEECNKEQRRAFDIHSRSLQKIRFLLGPKNANSAICTFSRRRHLDRSTPWRCNLMMDPQNFPKNKCLTKTRKNFPNLVAISRRPKTMSKLNPWSVLCANAYLRELSKIFCCWRACVNPLLTFMLWWNLLAGSLPNQCKPKVPTWWTGFHWILMWHFCWLGW